MAVLTPAIVYRKYVTDGVPESGNHDPKKAEIIQLLELIQGAGSNPAVVKQTKAALDLVTPASETYGGLVLNDSDATKNGYYYRDSAAWVKGRGFPDTFAKVALTGSGTAQTGALSSGVNPASIEVFFAKVATPNTGPMTLSVSGEAARQVVNLAGNPLSAGEWTGMVMFFLNEAGDYQLLIDAGAAQAAAQSATDAQTAEDAAEAARDQAVAAASSVSPTEYPSRADAQSTLHPISAPSFVRTAGYATAGDGGGALYEKNGGTTGDLVITLDDGVTDVGYDLAEVMPNVLMFGADPTGVADSQPAFAAANTYRKPCFVPKGRYRLNTGVPLSDGMKFYGVKGGHISALDGSVLLQYGQQAFIGDEDLRWATLSGFGFDFQGTAGVYTTALALKSHQQCVFEEFYFVRYTAATIIERIPVAATTNTVDNIYSNWMIENCKHIAISIGQDGWATTFQGDGTTTVINTGDTWPEQFNSSVVVLRETSNRSFVQMALTTDYTVSYPGGVLEVTLASPPTVNERIHIYPSQPRTDFATGKQRRPISNNRWNDIKMRFGNEHNAFIDVRWVDYEIYTNVRLHLNANGIRGFWTNPYTDRTGEAGDFNQYHACLVSYLSGVTDIATIWGWYFGPGSLQMGGYGVAADLTWVASGVNHTIQSVDGETVALTGTVTVDVGTPTIVTGSGTVFRDQLTLIGGSVDTIVIGSEIRGIASIDSDTQLTLTAPASAVSGVAASRRNSKNGNSYDFYFASLGGSSNPPSSNVRRGVGRAYAKSSTDFSGAATIAAGTTSVVVPHTLWRAPLGSKDKISITPTSNLDIAGTSRVCWVSNITAASFQLNINATAASSLNFNVAIELTTLN